MAQVVDEDSGLQLPASAVTFMNQVFGTTTEDVTADDGSVWSQALVSGPAGAPLKITPQTADNINFSRMKLSSAKVVYISIATVGEPLTTFHISEVQSLLQSELNSDVFDGLPPSQKVQIVLREETATPNKLGWDGSSKQSYTTRVIWGDVPAGGWAYSEKNKTTIQLDRIEATFSGLSNFEGTQFWVNCLAHESIWLNAGNQRDHTQLVISLPNPQPDGDIASGHVNPTTQFTVSGWSHSTIQSAFGF